MASRSTQMKADGLFDNKKMLNYEELAAVMGVSKSTLRKWVHFRKIPYRKLNGRLVRFMPEEISAWLRKRSS